MNLKVTVVAHKAIPEEARDLSCEGQCFLALMAEFRLPNVTPNCLYIRTVMLESFRNRGYLESFSDFGRLCADVGRLRGESAERVRMGLGHNIRLLWESCDGPGLMEKYFPGEGRRLPKFDRELEFLKVFAEIAEVYRKKLNSLGIPNTI